MAYAYNDVDLDPPKASNSSLDNIVEALTAVINRTRADTAVDPTTEVAPTTPAPSTALPPTSGCDQWSAVAAVFFEAHGLHLLLAIAVIVVLAMVMTFAYKCASLHGRTGPWWSPNRRETANGKVISSIELGE